MNEYDDLLKNTPGGNDYDGALVRDDERAKLRGSLYGALKLNPDEQARAKRIGTAAGIPPDVAARNLPEVEQRVKLNEYDALVGTKLGTKLQDPGFAKVAHDDAESLSRIESTIGPIQGPTPTVESYLTGLGTSFVEGGRAIRAGIRQQFADLLDLPDMRARAEREFGQSELNRAVTTPAFETATAAGVYGGLSSTLRVVPGIAASIAVRSPAPALAAAGVQTEAEAYAKYKSRGAAAGQALLGATGEAAVEVATELMPMSFLVNKFGKAGAGQFLSGLLLREIPSEQVATIAQDAIDTAIANPEKTWGQYLSERPDAAYQTLLATVVQTGVMGAGSAVMQRATRRDAQANLAEQNAQALTALGETAAESKLRTRDPEAFKQFVEAAVSDGPVTDVYVDAQTLGQVLQQSKVDMAQFTQAMPGVRAELEAATAINGDVRIPLADFTTHLADTEAGKVLLQHLRTSPDAVSQAEAKTSVQEQANALLADAQSTLAERDFDSAFKASAQSVEDQLAAQLGSVNRFTKDVNSVYAKMGAAFYTTQAARLGITPEEMYVKYPLRITAEGTTSASRLDQGDFPSIDLSLLDTPEIRPDVRATPFTAKDGASYTASVGEQTFGTTGSTRAVFVEVKDPSGKQIGKVDFAIRPDGVLTAENAIVDKAHKGKGIAEAMYRAARDAGYDIAPGRRQTDEGAPMVEAFQRKGLINREGLGVLNQSRVDADTGLPLNADGTVTVFHHTNAEAAERIRATGVLKAAAEPHVYVTTQSETDTGYGDTAIAIRVKPDTLSIDDEFPGGRRDFRIDVKKPGGSIRVTFDSTILEQPARGQIAFGDDLSQGATISLLNNADLSTFLHEMGHFQLEVLSDIAAQPNPPAEVVDDMNRLLKWFGVTDVATWRGMTLDQKRPHHEQFARGFEVYLFEGKAPSVELSGVFSRVRAWMVNVYRQLTNLNVQLTDEVRGVFDRMLATNDAILEAEQARRYTPILTDADLPAKAFAEYQDLGREATQEAVDDLQRRGLRDMQWLTNARSRKLKELQRDAKSKRASVEVEVRAEVMAEPINQARTFLLTGETVSPDGETIKATAGYRLSAEALQEMYPGSALGGLPWRDLPKGMVGNDGLHPSLVADMFGFKSADDLVHKLLTEEKPSEKITGLTDQRTLERYGDISSPSELSRAVDQALHNEARGKFIATEYKVLAKATGPVRVIQAAAREYASAVVDQRKLRDVRPAQFNSAETRAARRAGEAHAKGDIPGAASEKRNQMLNHALGRRAVEVLAEVDKARDYLRKFDTEGTRKALDAEYVEQIDALLERVELRPITRREDAKRKSLAEWVQQQRDNDLEPVIDEALLTDSRRVNYRDMSYTEFRGLVDSIKNIEHLGRLKRKLLTAKDQREFSARVEEVGSSIRDNAKRTVVVPVERATWASKLKEAGAEWFAIHRKFASLAREMDGHEDGGPMWEAFIRPLNESASNEASMRAEATEKLAALRKTIGSFTDKVFVPEVGQALTLQGRIMIALNTGTESNLQRLRDGDKWTQSQVDAVVGTLTKPQMDFVQGVWDMLESYRGQIGQQQKRLTGLEPEWLPAREVNTPHGVYRGGYVPAKYDGKRNTTSAMLEAASDIFDQWRAARGTPKTRDSFTKARAAEVKDRPLRKDFSTITQHISEVTHRLAYQDYLTDANRMLRATSIASAVQDHYGPEVLKALRNTVEDTAAGDLPASNVLERAVNHLRVGTTIAMMGWKVSTALIQISGYSQSISRIGPKWMGVGLMRTLGDAAKLESTARKVQEKSQMMANRAHTMQREVSEVLNTVSETESAIRGSFFYLTQRMQQMVDVPTWVGMYEKQIDAGKAEDVAIALADQAVLDAQGGGQIKDLAAVQRGSAYLKLFTNFYSYFNVTHNLAAEAIARTNFRSPTSVGLLAADYMLLFSLPAAFATLLGAALQGEDDEEKLAKKLAADQVSMMFGTMVGIREVASTIRAATGLPAGYEGPAGVRFFAELARLGKQASQGDTDEAALKAAASVTGIALHLPSAQISATLDGVAALADGRADDPRVLVSGSR